MIQATVRRHLTRDDAQLVARLIARDSGTSLEEIERKLEAYFQIKPLSCSEDLLGKIVLAFNNSQ